MPYDVFISHASEDQDAVATPLALALQQRGLSVWLDRLELQLGDSLRQLIDAGLREAGLTDLHPHDLKRTAVTWAFQRGMTIEDAVSWFDTSAVTLQAVYRAHHPDHQARAKAIMERRT